MSTPMGDISELIDLFGLYPLVFGEIGVEYASLGGSLEAEGTVIRLSIGETGQGLW